MKIDNLNFVGVTITQLKAPLPLSVVANAILIRTIFAQLLEPVIGRITHVFDGLRQIQLHELTRSSARYSLGTCEHDVRQIMQQSPCLRIFGS
jgi:hypothetical protein